MWTMAAALSFPLTPTGVQLNTNQKVAIIQRDTS